MSDENRTVRERAQLLLEERMTAIDGVDKAAAAADAARVALEEAEQELIAALDVATDAGWTSNELRQLGITIPDQPKRSTRRKSTRKSTGGQGRGTAPGSAGASNQGQDGVSLAG
ncbi:MULTISPECIES: hypothetical protein [Pimelobacter]|uniref:hypothetical protein n=1 Tax=Pimelobacter TaxID=2044 RepID=UPI001C057967|nr:MULTISPECIES: hypothetical protein [Pimelobacter]UUW93000.1 hypothetical protein M0M43_30670 [Pimelobacter simplex]UUW99033.1 hypothetical protein M0M48_30690 [Pimelobacter simplex]